MQIVVQFKQGDPLVIPVSSTHTVQVLPAQGGVQDAFSFDGVVGLEFVENENKPEPIAERLPSQHEYVMGEPGTLKFSEVATTADQVFDATELVEMTADEPSAVKDNADHAEAVAQINTHLVAVQDAETEDEFHDLLDKAKTAIDAAAARWPGSDEVKQALVAADRIGANASDTGA